jgi:hypothetical protein
VIRARKDREAQQGRVESEGSVVVLVLPVPPVQQAGLRTFLSLMTFLILMLGMPSIQSVSTLRELEWSLYIHNTLNIQWLRFLWELKDGTPM